ncbi:MAG: hypothetical protein KIT45_02215 [Fimbriimonadia bacterium]|nr:hypothetical protein [Fimbriimonadia bacterium]
MSIQHAQDNWFVAILIAIISLFILFNIFRARKGRALYIRRIAGLDAIDDAIGRATEMGRPILLIPGMTAFGVIAMQSLNIFKYITRESARFATPMRFLTANPTVYTVAQETIQEAYQEAGRPELYEPDSIRFLSDRQFAFASGAAGLMQREKVAANFMFGEFFAESLIFAETGNMVGAIQIAGTVSTTQVPFFVAACDYTIIGEEFYATSAYLSREPVLLGSLVGQDWAKILFASLILFGSLVATFWGTDTPLLGVFGKAGGWDAFFKGEGQ